MVFYVINVWHLVHQSQQSNLRTLMLYLHEINVFSIFVVVQNTQKSIHYSNKSHNYHFTSSLFYLCCRTDPFFSRGHPLFEDLDGFHAHTTTFSDGSGSTIHITRTVIGDDGSVRREMRFRTPTSNPTPQSAPPSGAKRPTARVPPNVKPHTTPSTSSGKHVPPTASASSTTSSTEGRGQPDGASAAPDSNTPTKPASNTHRRHFGTSSGGSSSPRYASPTQSSSRRGVGVGAPASSPSRATPTSTTSHANNASSSTNNVRVQPTQRGSSSSRPRPGGTRRRPHHDSGNGSGHAAAKQLIQCPLCSRSYEKHVIEVHAADCEGRPEEASSSIPPDVILQQPEVVTIPDDDFPGMRSSAYVNLSTNNNENKVECPICSQSYHRDEIEAHAANCGEEVYV